MTILLQSSFYSLAHNCGGLFTAVDLSAESGNVFDFTNAVTFCAASFKMYSNKGAEWRTPNLFWYGVASQENVYVGMDYWKLNYPDTELEEQLFDGLFHDRFTPFILFRKHKKC